MTLESGNRDTFPRLLLGHALERGDDPAIREKALGIWQSWSWAEVRDEIEWLACGLAQAGLARGDHIDHHLVILRVRARIGNLTRRG